MSDHLKILATRTHPTLQTRKEQIAFNVLALKGGRPYVETRLSKFPSESNVGYYGQGAFGGKDSFGSSKLVTGRLSRAYALNHCARIAKKLNQYIFAKEPARQGIDEDFAQDVTLDRLGINPFMSALSETLTAARWAWLSVDGPEAPKDADGNPIVMNRKQASDVRPYWSIW